jgi:hypothetical protein
VIYLVEFLFERYHHEQGTTHIDVLISQNAARRLEDGLDE